MSEEYYNTLGVNKNASSDEIKKAYKKLAKKHHPDLNKGDAGSEKKFKELNEAFSVLGDAKKRENYDRFGKAGANGQYGSSGFGGFGGGGGFEGFDFGGSDPFSDIFDTFFGGRGSRRKRNSARRGADLVYDLEISLEEAHSGIKKNIQFNKEETCDKCKGTGAESSADVVTCPICQGSGVIAKQQKTPFGVFQSTASCSNCNGSGQVIKKPCSKCGGKGRAKVHKNIDITIPAGVDNGNKLRVSREGEAGEKGGASGDLYVRIHVKEHELFTREELDIYTTIPVSFTQAAIGSSIEVPTLEGKAKLKINSGTQSGTSFRMKGKGMPSINGYGKGDEYVKIEIKTPKKLNKKQKELLEEFDKTFSESPYKSFMEKIKKWL